MIVNDGEKVIKDILSYAGITEEELVERTRKGGVITWRRIACYLLYDYCMWTQQRIADRLFYERHETVAFHANKVRFWMDNPKIAPIDLRIAVRNLIHTITNEDLHRN